MRLVLVVGAALFGLAAASLAPWRDGSERRPSGAPFSVHVPTVTSREGLDRTIDSLRRRVEAEPGDGEAAVRLADALVRAARVRSDAALALEAERVLRSTLAHDPSDYGARRMVGVAYLAQHRFADALRAAHAAQAARPADAWNYAVAGDALLEMGRYDEAFDAFDEAMSRRPDAAAYARAAYARELQGDLDGAVQLMQMAAEGTPPHDLEARAWTFAQLGNLYLLQSRLDDAAREFDRAEFTFPGHPYAANGRVRLLIARGELRQALQLVASLPATPESLAIKGDLQALLGDATAAEETYREAERREREGWEHEEPQPAALARFLAERGRDPEAAVALAETAAAGRQDIHTMDALAWAYFHAGRLDEASAAIARALRTGTADPRIRCHAATIAAARAGSPPPASACDPLSLIAAPADAIRSASGGGDDIARR